MNTMKGLIVKIKTNFIKCVQLLSSSFSASQLFHCLLCLDSVDKAIFETCNVCLHVRGKTKSELLKRHKMDEIPRVVHM